MGEVIDRYHLNLYCTCLSCENLFKGNYARSCKQYNYRNGIPPEIWNTENAQCPYYELKEKTDT